MSNAATVAVPAQYAPLFVASGKRWGVPPAVLAAVANVEDGFGTGPFQSAAGAQGFMQFEPGTAAAYGVDVHSPASSIDGAAHYLHDLLAQFHGSMRDALAAYNAGPGNIGAGQGYASTVLAEAANVTGLSGVAQAIAQAVFPLGPGYTITQKYHDPSTGGTHPGVDLADPKGTPIYAAESGVIESVGGDPTGFGNDYPVERLADGTRLTYGHAEKSFVSPGQSVKAGQIIALVGSEGDSTGPHLHFQVNLPNGSTTDPLAWLSQQQASPTINAQLASFPGGSWDPLNWPGQAASGIAGAFSSGIKTLVFWMIKGVAAAAGAGLIVLGFASAAGKSTSFPAFVPIPA